MTTPQRDPKIIWIVATTNLERFEEGTLTKDDGVETRLCSDLKTLDQFLKRDGPPDALLLSGDVNQKQARAFVSPVRALSTEVQIAGLSGHESSPSSCTTVEATLSDPPHKEELLGLFGKTPAARVEPEKKRVLIVDDEESIRELTARMLSLEGLDIHTADSGEAALEELQKDTFDLLLLDLHMPGMPGREVLYRLQDLPHNHVPPVLVMSGRISTWGSNLDGVVVLDVIRKPFQIDYLTQKVQEALEGELPALPLSHPDRRSVD